MPNAFEKTASNVMGAAKTVKATLENLSGVFKQLEKEHGEVTALLRIVNASSDPAKRRELFPRIRAELLAHEKGELAEVYPAFREHANLAGYAEIHEREAGTLEQTITKLTSIDYADPKWGSTFAELVAAVTHHVKEEEGDFFPAANRELGKDAAEQLKDRYLAAKAALMKGIRP
jgi:hemerythrin superfamily protein